MPHTSAQIWQDYHSRLHQFILGRVNNEAEAEDILQDIFLRIHSHIDSLDEAEHLQAWIYRVARNAVIDHYRRRRPMDELPADLQTPDTEEADIRRELGGCLEPMIDALPEPYRTALRLSEMQGITQKSLAEQEGLSLSGAKSRVQRGRSMVKALMLDCCHFEFDIQGRVIDYAGKDDSCGPRCDSCR